MKFLAKILCIGTLLAATAPFAKADSGNQISFNGNDIVNLNTGAVTFTDANGAAAGNAYTGPATGIFTSFVGGAATFHDFNYLSTSVPFVLITDIANGISATFTVNSFTYALTSMFGVQGVDVAGSGIYTLSNGMTINNGAFLFTTQSGATTFSDLNTTVTPEPNSLMLLGTGLVSAAGMLVRRRRAIA